MSIADLFHHQAPTAVCWVCVPGTPVGEMCPSCKRRVVDVVRVQGHLHYDDGGVRPPRPGEPDSSLVDQLYDFWAGSDTTGRA